jgi:hypothetical protein
VAKLSDPWDHHDWSSQEYVSRWAERQDDREAEREKIFARWQNHFKGSARSRRHFDLGAGCSALRDLLENLPNAKAVCQDGSAIWSSYARMTRYKGR